jgi:methionyl-tRNA formyltransferase
MRRSPARTRPSRTRVPPSGGSRRVPILRTVFLGTSEFAATVLERLAASEHRPALVLSRPDRPRGRGRRLAAPPVSERALALGLTLAQPESVNEPAAGALIAEAQPQALVVCAFGALIKEPLLSEHELLNVHPSLLPRWRGAAPIERAIMAGDERTGVSIMRLTAGLDSGPVCLTAAEPITPEDTYGSLATRLAKIGGELLVRALDLTAAGAPPTFAEQDEAGVTYAEKIVPADRLLDPALPASELERLVRALHPHIGARVALQDGTLLGVQRARVAADRAPAGEMREGEIPVGVTRGGETPAGAPPAGTLGAVDGRLLYGAHDRPLELLEVQPPGGRPMDAAAYLRGYAR